MRSTSVPSRSIPTLFTVHAVRGLAFSAVVRVRSYSFRLACFATSAGAGVYTNLSPLHVAGEKISLSSVVQCGQTVSGVQEHLPVCPQRSTISPVCLLKRLTPFCPMTDAATYTCPLTALVHYTIFTLPCDPRRISVESQCRLSHCGVSGNPRRQGVSYIICSYITAYYSSLVLCTEVGNPQPGMQVMGRTMYSCHA